MPLRAVTSSSLPDQIFGQLASEILSGVYAPGDHLPAERTLAEVFGVNRHAVREALKRAEQIGLVKIVHGGATRVLDYRESAGLDLLTLLAENAVDHDPAGRIWLAGMEMRAAIAGDIARLCARRASSEVKQQLVEISEQLAAGPSDVDIVALDERYWELMLEGADNIAYRLAFNSVIRGAHLAPAQHRAWISAEIERSEYRKPVVAAIAASDQEAAESLTIASLRPAVEALEAAVHSAVNPIKGNAPTSQRHSRADG